MDIRSYFQLMCTSSVIRIRPMFGEAYIFIGGYCSTKQGDQPTQWLEANLSTDSALHAFAWPEVNVTLS